MRGTAKVEYADSVDVTLTATATVAEWRKVREALRNDRAPFQMPVHEFSLLIQQLIAKVTAVLEVVEPRAEDEVRD
jgi:hypothetical protein